MMMRTLLAPIWLAGAQLLSTVAVDAAPAGRTPGCVASPTALCLNHERFRVEVDWRDFTGRTGSGRVTPVVSEDSGLFWFFDADNWEMLVKVLDGCGVNDHFWVFAAATTNVETTLRVTDTVTGDAQSYFNPLGNAAAAITDAAAFATCASDESGCITGEPIADVLHGDLGPAPSGGFDELTCLEIANYQPLLRDAEIAYSGIPLPRSLNLLTTDRLAVVGPGERRLAAQFDVLARWGGSPDDETLPIRWLQVSLQPRVDPGGTAVYALRRYHALSPAGDPYAATITARPAAYEVDTGLATFTLDPAHPALLAEIAIAPDDGAGRSVVYTHTPGAGPRLVWAPGGSEQVLDTADPARVVVDPGSFRIVERGPVKVVVAVDGHFVAPGGASLCTVAGDDGPRSYERFGYTAVLSFTRASRDLGLEYYFRNECSDAFSGPWTDEAVTIRQASWELPWDGMAAATVYYAGEGAVGAAPATGGLTLVEQRRGGGTPWRRRARVLHDGSVREAAETFLAPLTAIGDVTLIVAAQIPWMRYREPQALAVDGKTLSLRFLSEELIVGEGKGVWNLARLHLVPTALAAATGSVEGYLEGLRDRHRLALERGLLVRSPRAQVNAAGLFPSLGTDAPSPVKAAYRATLEALHDQTVRPGGQWERARTFGSQLWPDVQYDLYQIDHADPFENSGAMNYWNPSGAELWEFLRTGEPRWVWEFALPQSWLQAHTAYLNVGAQGHGNRAGFAVTSGGTGEGQWHRSAVGSDDYSYNAGLALAYVLRPSVALRDRFAQAGRTAVERYSIPRQNHGDREPWVNQVDVTRQVIQHFEMLAHCAEFVPGEAGSACQERLREVVRELVEDNLAAGIFCQGDPAVPPTIRCGQPQQFMVSALMVHFFHRYLRNYGDEGGLLARALVHAPLTYYHHGIPKRADGVSIDLDADWAAALDCTLSAGGSEVAACTWAETGDGPFLLNPNKPHTAALLLLAHELDPTIGLCQLTRAALDDPALTASWSEYLGNDSGWWKGAAQMLQGMVFGVGIYDTCSDP